MATHPPKRQVAQPERAVIQWLLDSDPAIRWQVMQDLAGSPVEEVAAERARVATQGWGARLLALQVPLSPSMRTGTSAVATLRMEEKTFCICGLIPSIPSNDSPQNCSSS